MTMVTRLWSVLLAAAVIGWIGLAASARANDRVLAVLQEYAFIQDSGQREDLERLAADLVNDEIAKRRPDPTLVSAAFAVLRQSAIAEQYRAALEAGARARLDAEFARPRPDPQELRSAHALLALAGAADAGEQLARIAALAGDRGALAQRLAKTAAQLRDEAGTSAGDALLRVLVDERAQLLAPRPGVGPMTWAVAETPAVATALEDAAQAALIHFEALLGSVRPADIASSPDRIRVRTRLVSAWSSLHAMGIADRCDAQTLAAYAHFTRLDALDAGGWLVAAVLAACLVGGALISLRRLWRGPSPIDPGAETIENEAPIDLDTEAETLEAAHSRPGHDTTIP